MKELDEKNLKFKCASVCGKYGGDCVHLEDHKKRTSCEFITCIYSLSGNDAKCISVMEIKEEEK